MIRHAVCGDFTVEETIGLLKCIQTAQLLYKKRS